MTKLTASSMVEKERACQVFTSDLIALLSICASEVATVMERAPFSLIHNIYCIGDGFGPHLQPGPRR